ncbi:MAG: branched-chain amino acid ABC transporter substrate-binding protein [Chloroflexi bacterium]|nr:branched-chain amino acid ABC transporter substrate-binding protein [Chloroflexota bacterium]
MKRFPLFALLALASILISACGAVTAFKCTDPLGCVTLGSGESLKIATMLTMSGPNKVYGVDALRGVQIAMDDAGNVLGRRVELIQEDEQCSEQGGKEAATRLAANPNIIGVIGATCSSAALSSAKILSDAGFLVISPSSTAPSLTDPLLRQPGFFRSIYNDKAQGRAVAEFAFNVLGLRRMVTLHDGTAYPKQLQQAACDSFQSLGGECVEQIDLSNGQDVLTALKFAALSKPDVLYYPVYTKEGAAITRAISEAGLSNAALISSDGLLSTDFIQQAQPYSEGMYLSGPNTVQEPQTFIDKYQAKYGEKPNAPYHLQAYDAANMLFYAMQQSAVVVGDKLYIQRQKLRDALYNMQGIQGLSGKITCSTYGDCAAPDIEIFQVVRNQFKPIFP